MHTAPATATEAGMLLSLAAALPDPSCPLARRARRLADRLALHPSRATHKAAADALADLLTACDVDLGAYDLGDDVLLSDFEDL